MVRLEIMFGKRWRYSVGRRLALLVILGAATSVGLLLLAGLALRAVDADLAYMRRFVFAPVEALGAALEDAAQVQALAEQIARGRDTGSERSSVDQKMDRLYRFVSRYRLEWEVTQNPSPDARRFRAQLDRVGRADLVDQEAEVVAGLVRRIHAITAQLRAPEGQPHTAATLVESIRGVREALRRLLEVNLAFVNVSYTTISHHGRVTAFVMLFVGGIGTLAATLFGLRVHQAIAPRIAQLVGKVRRFQELGINERVPERGEDEIAVLANALDAGFESIAARDREREEFLAVASHELKTPLTSLVGFSQRALEATPPSPQRERALEVLGRQSSRLVRLIDDLLLAASVRIGNLPYRPKPIDLVPLMRRTVAEVEASVRGRRFELALPESARLLGDEELLAQGLWSLLSVGLAASPGNGEVPVKLTADQTCWRTDIAIADASRPFRELNASLSPFSVVLYEEGTGVRGAIGLFLSREVARLHGGALRLHEDGGGHFVLSFELPI